MPEPGLDAPGSPGLPEHRLETAAKLHEVVGVNSSEISTPDEIGRGVSQDQADGGGDVIDRPIAAHQSDHVEAVLDEGLEVCVSARLAGARPGHPITGGFVTHFSYLFQKAPLARQNICCGCEFEVVSSPSRVAGDEVPPAEQKG